MDIIDTLSRIAANVCAREADDMDSRTRESLAQIQCVICMLKCELREAKAEIYRVVGEAGGFARLGRDSAYAFEVALDRAVIAQYCLVAWRRIRNDLCMRP